MAKKRQRANKKKSTKVEIKQTKPLMSGEAQYFQELVDVSNRYAALLKQKAQYEFIVNKLQENRKKIQSGKIKMPVTLPLIPNVMNYSESDKKEIFKFFDEQITGYKNSVKDINGQLGHRYEEYVEIAVRTREFLTKRYGDLKGAKIVQARAGIKDEENLFEAEFNKLMKTSDNFDPKVKAEFEAAKKQAIKVNTRAVKETKKAGIASIKKADDKLEAAIADKKV